MRNYIFILGSIIAFLAGVIVFFVWFIFPQPHKESSTEVAFVPQNRDDQQREYGYNLEAAQNLNLQLQRLIVQYTKTNEVQRQEIITHMKNIAGQRKKQLVLLTEQNPKEFYRFEIPSELRKQAPETIQEDLEKWVSKEGALTVYDINDSDTGKGLTVRTLSTKQGYIIVSVARNAEQLKNLTVNTLVKITGLLIGHILLVHNPETDIEILE